MFISQRARRAFPAVAKRVKWAKPLCSDRMRTPWNARQSGKRRPKGGPKKPRKTPKKRLWGGISHNKPSESNKVEFSGYGPPSKWEKGTQKGSEKACEDASSHSKTLRKHRQQVSWKRRALKTWFFEDVLYGIKVFRGPEQLPMASKNYQKCPLIPPWRVFETIKNGHWNWHKPKIVFCAGSHSGDSWFRAQVPGNGTTIIYRLWPEKMSYFMYIWLSSLAQNVLNPVFAKPGILVWKKGAMNESKQLRCKKRTTAVKQKKTALQFFPNNEQQTAKNTRKPGIWRKTALPQQKNAGNELVTDNKKSHMLSFRFLIFLCSFSTLTKNLIKQIPGLGDSE